MATNQELIDKLIEKLEILFKKQAEFSSEIESLKEELYHLKSGSVEEEALPVNEEVIAEPELEIQKDAKPIIETEFQSKFIETEEEPIVEKKPKGKSSLEKFIGENILNKIGIIITIIGVAIGAKYSIENDLISPLTRIILGYFTAIGLLGFGIKLKKKYEAYSAVLVSGSIVILYFITFFAYSFYDLIPQSPTFALMVIFTAFTVVAAISYNRQVIAHIGLVGAYAIPFLLSDGSGRIEILFSYMAIINIGILIISFKKYWKSLYYSAFIFTWLIFASWFSFEYYEDEHFSLGLSFLTIFFIIFYMTFLAYKMLKKEVFKISDVVLLLLNSFLFYGFGFAILDNHETGTQLLGLFTLGNAVIHFIVSVIFYKMKLGDKNLFYLASAMVLVFITITIPVQLDGNWVTLLWVSEAALLFWLGRTKGIKVYEKLSYPLMILAFLSLLQDWSFAYSAYYGLDEENHITNIFNIHFLNSLLFVAAFGSIVWLSLKDEYTSALKSGSIWSRVLTYVIPSILAFSAYYAFRLEIELYWDQLYHTTKIIIPSEDSYDMSIFNYDLRDFKTIWILNYSLLFVALLSFINFKLIKNTLLEKIILGFTVMSIFVFLSQGLLALSDLRESYLNPSEYFSESSFYLGIRYVSFVFLALALFTCYKFIKREGISKAFKIGYDILLHISIIWVLSSELIHWMDMSESTQSYKLGLSILWGVYSFLLIAFGIWKDKAYLRIGGMIFFGITLIKLFFYDIVHLNTISKTIVFVSLGVLLLIISFLYNKYKNQITDDVND
ncbi:DUF2339 domain-containing protein [Winogradskyella psychrotolerans]|uniref:DUF2339 domain-containing protein n=1 Tax=Winogradskyella psychrotolerans TaxID=1344585 RepID=UPI001C07C137|nr:DUF2339 domain-containing protein [Winogradskyella psychrotolerans]MBU2928898.1 DUF2339 domain-containing protein [Winogradskyella psychrotolerans]